MCAIIGTIRRGFEDLYEAKEILLHGDESDFFEINNRDISDNVLSRRSYYFGPSSGSVGMVRKNGNNQFRKAIPKTSYGSRRASFNSLLTLGNIVRAEHFDMKIFKYFYVKIFKYFYMKIFKYFNMKIFKYFYMKIFKYFYMIRIIYTSLFIHLFTC